MNDTNKEDYGVNEALIQNGEDDRTAAQLAQDEQPDVRSRQNLDDSEGSASNECKRVANITNESGPFFFAPSEAQDLHVQWENIQFGFVDDPKHSVDAAARLIGDTIKRIAEGYLTKHQQFDQQKDLPSTEDLRLALCRYRSLFEHLISI